MAERSVLFLSPYPASVPSHRVRLEQYVPYLASHGVRAVVRSLLDEHSYRSGGPSLASAVARGAVGRLVDVLRAGRYDAVLLHREAVPMPTALFERILARTSRRYVFDFDDAIYLPQPRPRSLLSAWLRSPAKFRSMVAGADEVLAGNRLLADVARRHARSVTVIPTTVDTERFAPGGPRTDDSVVIGWIGSPSTAPYVDVVAPAIGEVLSRHPRAVFEMVGAPLRSGFGDRARARPWSLKREVEDLRGLDIGIMPLTDDEWTRGKCGYKALQYMSTGLATVGSPVGVATEIIEDGRTGFLATSRPEWVDALSRLIRDAHLRRSLGSAARAFVEEHYSLRAWAPRFLDALLRATAP